MDYVLHIVTIAAIYSILAIALDLLVGHAGLLSLASAGFAAVGAYAAALVAIHWHVPFEGGLCLSMGVSGGLGCVLAYASRRMGTEYFAVGTLAFQLVVLSLINNSVFITGGPFGISGVPAPWTVAGVVTSRYGFTVLAIGSACCVQLIAWRIVHSPIGRVLRAIREDEVFAAALGKNTKAFKAGVIIASASLSGWAGHLYAQYVTHVDPLSFGIGDSILVMAMVVLGGAGGRWGPLLGACVLVLLPELLQWVGMTSSVAANVRQVVYGSALVFLMLFRPQGVVGGYRFGKERGGVLSQAGSG